MDNQNNNITYEELMEIQSKTMLKYYECQRHGDEKGMKLLEAWEINDNMMRNSK